MAASRTSSPRDSSTFEFTSKSVEETQQFGERLGALLQPGDVVAMIGELGSGKTTCIQGLARGLGVNPDVVKSPTFVLMREYPGRIGLNHLDAYRIEGDPSVVWLDLELVFSSKRVTVIEWADRVPGCLPDAYLELRLAHKTSQRRAIGAHAHGSRSQQILERLREVVQQQDATHGHPGD